MSLPILSENDEPEARMLGSGRTKRSFSGLTMEEAFRLVPAEDVVPWNLVTQPRIPSANLVDNLRRLESFELFASEAAKITLIDVLLAEIVPDYARLKVWKSAPLDSPTVAGIADYLVAPKRAYVKTPLLCVIEAKKDDFELGQVQCVAEMAVCHRNNHADGHESDVFGIVSNGQGWVFYRLTNLPEIFVTGLFTTNDLPTLLGALDHVCAACAANVPVDTA